MEFGTLPEIIGVITALLVAFGGGVKWMISWADRKVQKVQDRLESHYQERFAALESRVEHQEKEMQRNRDDLAKYIRHVGKLEGLLTAHGIDVPPMESR